MVWFGGSRKGSALVPPAARGEQGPAEHGEQIWVWHLPQRCSGGTMLGGDY